MKKRGMFYSKHIIEKELRHHLLEWGATALSIFGSVLNAYMFIEGFYIWGIANILWMAFSWKFKHWGLFVQNLVFFGINIVGFMNWFGSGNFHLFFWMN